MSLTQARCCHLLGLTAAATADETRAAYRKLARQMHPDRVGGDGERFKEITAAYNWLIARQTGRVVDPTPRAERRRAPTSRGHYRHRAPDPTPGDEIRADAWRAAEHARQAAEAARRAAEDARRTEEAARRAEEDAREAAAQAQADTERQRREARRRARRAAWESEREAADSKWDEEFADAWDTWCRTAERYHAEQRRARAADRAASRADRAAATDADPAHPETARPWRPARAPAADKPSLFRRVQRGVEQLRRKVALDRVGQDVSLRLPIDRELLLHGGARTLAIHRAAACPTCLGRDPACATCDGDGRVRLREPVRVTVPPGARPGARLRLEGKGTAGLDGAPDGDLYLLLEPEPIPGFTRDGDDLRGALTLDRALATRGGKLEVELPRGRIKLAVPPGTRPGDTLRLRGQGLPAWRAATAGDLFLTVAIR
ncbi:MAG: DnaJ C-terminal domain-containing protein [bacterium]